MNKVLNFLLISLVSVQVFAGPGSSGGGKEAPNNGCQVVPESINQGFYRSLVQVGIGQGESLLIDSGAVLVLEGLFGAKLTLNLIGGLTRTGREFIGSGKINDKECSFQIRVKRYVCQGSQDEMVLVEMPFWLSEYAFNPARYNYNCKNAVQQNVNNSSSGRVFGR